jgi:hypothetical protein
MHCIESSSALPADPRTHSLPCVYPPRCTRETRFPAQTPARPSSTCITLPSSCARQLHPRINTRTHLAAEAGDAHLRELRALLLTQAVERRQHRARVEFLELARERRAELRGVVRREPPARAAHERRPAAVSAGARELHGTHWVHRSRTRASCRFTSARRAIHSRFSASCCSRRICAH